VVFDYELGAYYKESTQYIDKLYEELHTVKLPSGSKAEQLFDDMVGTLSHLEDMRNKSSVISLERLTKGQWGILLLLAAIIIISVFTLKGGAIFSDVTSVMLSTILILVLLIIRDLENFKLAGQALMVESGQENLETMGMMRYYNHREIEQGTVEIPPHVKQYRIGMHEAGEEFDIQIVDVGENT